MSPRLVQQTTTSFPVAMRPPVFAAVAGGVVHVFGSDESNRASVRSAIGFDGKARGPAAGLDCSVIAVAACGDELIITGMKTDYGWCVMRVDATGGLSRQAPVPAPTDGLVLIKPVCFAAETQIVWEVEGDGVAELSLASVRDGRVEEPLKLSQKENAYGLHVAVIGERVFVLRSRGSELAGDLLCFENGALVARAEVVRNAQRIVAIGNGLLVLAWTPRQLLLQSLDASLASIEEAQPVVTAEPSSWIRFATFHAADEERVAISYLAGYSDDLISLPSGREEPGEYTRHFLGRYDLAAQQLTDIAIVEPAGIAWLAGDWIDDRLLLIHGTTGAALTVFELERD
jgi:hypothetical protein